MYFQYKTIKAAALNELSIKIASARESGWVLEGDVEVIPTMVKGKKVSMFFQDMVRYNFEPICAI